LLLLLLSTSAEPRQERKAQLSWFAALNPLWRVRQCGRGWGWGETKGFPSWTLPARVFFPHLVISAETSSPCFAGTPHPPPFISTQRIR
jgi:hypothetical protein